jgi:hypothetical protein
LNDQVTVVIPHQRGGNQDWLKRAIASLPKDTPYLLAENDGQLHHALNQALRQVETEFVFRLDSDDWLDPDALDFLVGLAWDTDVCYPTLVLTNEQGGLLDAIKAHAFCPHRLLIDNYIPGCALFRPEKALEVGGYREFPLLEDWDLWVRMSRAGCRFKAVPEARYWYRQHPDSRNKVPAGEEERIVSGLHQRIVGAEPELQATFYYQASFPQTYLRCLLPSRYLPGQASDFPRMKPVGEDSLEFPLHRGDTAVWQFPGDGARAVQMAEMQLQGTRVLVEADDNYLSAHSAQIQKAWGRKVGSQVHTLEAHAKITSWADGVIVTTEELAKKYRKANPNVFVCPNQVDPPDWEPPVKPDDGVFRIGWFASHSHSNDAQLVRRALEWASGQKDVEVVTMGFHPSWTFRHRHFPWSNDLGVYRRLLQLLDVGLAPVVPDAWSVCRSDVKALDYAMGLVCPVVSDERPYDAWPGLKARTAAEFFHHVRHLVTHRDEARQLAEAARQHVLAERTIETNVWRWEEACSTRQSAPARAATTR